MRPALLLLLLSALLLPACGGDESATWTRLDAADLDAAQRGQQARADAARGAMFKALFARLQEALAKGGPAEAIGVCREEAPAIAVRVAKENGVQIGRTAARLRNPDNRAPAWARELVAQEVTEPVFLAHGDGRLATLHPIRLMAGCVMCHGPADKLHASVKEELARSYPEDQATGFAEGDLRGWFWVEVPRP